MARPNIFVTLLALLLTGLSVAVLAAEKTEEIESDISSRNIAIESNFTGSRIVIFGTINNSLQADQDVGIYDIAIAIRGPNRTIVTRRKSKVAGIWINQASQTFANAPGYYAVMSNRPLPDIAEQKVLNAYGLGYHSLDFEPVKSGDTKPSEPGLAEFREAAIRIKQNEGLYIHDPAGVVFVGRNLFRTTIDLPANVPVGTYASDVYLLRKGKVLSHNRSDLTINKEGFERFVFSAAFDYPLIYGILAVIMAVTAGLLASALTRRD